MNESSKNPGGTRLELETKVMAPPEPLGERGHGAKRLFRFLF
jgi:hypothetical protein